MNNVGNRVVELRQQRGLSQYKLYQLAGISQATLSEIESNKKVPTVTTLAKICKALNISLSAFFSEDDVIAANQDHNEIDNLPDHVKKELDIAREFILYKHGIKKASTDK
jgi:transcriptional regulator with XRE-family HTH domain